LRVAGGATVGATTSLTGARFLESLLLTPDVPLTPATAYEVLDTTLVPCEPDAACVGTPVVVATFTTVTVSDADAPLAANVAVDSAYDAVGEST
jgi:hypothetical protein